MGNLVPLALAAAFYPTTLAVVVTPPFTRPNPARLLGAFLIGGLTTSVLVGLGVLALIKGSGVVGGSSSHSISPTIDAIAGLLSLSLAFLGRDGPPASVRRPPGGTQVRQADGTAQPKDPSPAESPSALWLVRALCLGSASTASTVRDLAVSRTFARAGHLRAPTSPWCSSSTRSCSSWSRSHSPSILLAPERAAAAAARFDQWSRSHLRQIGSGGGDGDRRLPAHQRNRRARLTTKRPRESQ